MDDEDDAPEAEQLELPMVVPAAPCPKCGKLKPHDDEECDRHRLWRAEMRAKFLSLDWSGNDA